MTDNQARRIARVRTGLAFTFLLAPILGALAAIWFSSWQWLATAAVVTVSEFGLFALARSASNVKPDPTRCDCASRVQRQAKAVSGRMTDHCPACPFRGEVTAIVTEAMQTTGRARPKSTESGEVRP